jgi:phage-related protein
MIRSITITNHLNEELKLELGAPEKSGLLVRRIDGIGPSKADINMTEIATFDGAVYNSARVAARNIVMSLEFIAKPTIEDTRHLTYRYFPIKKRIMLTFETDKRICDIYGYVESNEPDIFSKREGTTISILCPAPFFYSKDKTVTVFSGPGSIGEFEFPFSNESLVENLIVISTYRTDTVKPIMYDGDEEVGVTITINSSGNVSNITIYDTDNRDTIRIDTGRLTAMIGTAIIAGDEITISTIKGNKFAVLHRGVDYYNIVNCLDKDTGWFYLMTGENMFAYAAESGVEHLSFRIENQTVYGGI